MPLDPATLGAVSIFLSALMGGLLLFSWFQNRTITALAWWGAGFCLGAIGVGILGIQSLAGVPTPEAIAMGNAFVAFGLGCHYCGCRDFNGRQALFIFGLSGPAIWLMAWPIIAESFPARLALMGLVTGAYLALSGWELLKHAPQRLMSQRTAVVVFFIGAVFCLARGLFGPSFTPGIWSAILASRWSAEMALFILLYIPTIAFIMISMAKERLEYLSNQAALLDPLTLIPNRRAFFLNANALATRFPLRPLSCIIFDLDNFKRINDTYGHHIGDSLLQVFTGVLAQKLPVGTFGRLGGEEFAVFIPTDAAHAEQLGDEIRLALTSDASLQLGIHATVSAGYATRTGSTPQAMLPLADDALYRAKAAGKDRVVNADDATEHSSGILYRTQSAV